MWSLHQTLRLRVRRNRRNVRLARKTPPHSRYYRAYHHYTTSSYMFHLSLQRIKSRAIILIANDIGLSCDRKEQNLVDLLCVMCVSYTFEYCYIHCVQQIYIDSNRVFTSYYHPTSWSDSSYTSSKYHLIVLHNGTCYNTLHLDMSKLVLFLPLKYSCLYLQPVITSR